MPILYTRMAPVCYGKLHSAVLMLRLYSIVKYLNRFSFCFYMHFIPPAVGKTSKNVFDTCLIHIMTLLYP